MDDHNFERIEVYNPDQELATPFGKFKKKFDNIDFRTSKLTYITLFVLMILYPAQGFMGDQAEMLKSLNEGMRIFLYISTIIFQWVIFLLIFGSTYRENTGLKGIGLKRIRMIDFAWAISFLLGANLILTGLAWLMAQIGLPMPGEIGLLIPENTSGKILWVALSFTAGFCEEAAFRGYIMTRLRLLGKTNGWLIPTILSSVVFGACHAYQGLPGFILISVYGLLFALLYIRTGSLWPCVIAHFFQDFGALFFPQ